MKLLYIDCDGYKVFADGYKLFRNKNNGSITYYSRVKDRKNSFLSITSLSRRFFRAEITRFYRLADGTELCIARKGIFRKAQSEKIFTKCFAVPRGSRPMNICEASDGNLYFGEYFMNMEKKAVQIYCSSDSGKSWNVVYTFTEGNINHVHGIYRDPYTDRLWCITGDRENECIIGYSDNGFKTVNEVFRGGQDYRSCVLFFYPDFLVFATDSQYQKNYIKKIDRRTLKITTLQEVQGPAIKGTQCGDVCVISTDVEPSDVNKDKSAYVWYTKNGTDWQVLCSAEKDCWHPTLFQFGVFDLPIFEGIKTNTLYVTGKALRKCDNKILSFKI